MFACAGPALVEMYKASHDDLREAAAQLMKNLGQGNEQSKTKDV